MNLNAIILYKWVVKKKKETKNSLHMANECQTSLCLIAQSFIQVGLDGVQEVGCVDVMFIQLTPAR